MLLGFLLLSGPCQLVQGGWQETGVHRTGVPAGARTTGAGGISLFGVYLAIQEGWLCLYPKPSFSSSVSRSLDPVSLTLGLSALMWVAWAEVVSLEVWSIRTGGLGSPYEHAGLWLLEQCTA